MNLFKDLLSSVLWPASFEGLPAGGESLGLGDDRIRNVVKATRERLEHEHIKDMTTGTPAQDGWHRQGSAKCYFQTDPPETRPDGVTALTADDNGRVWVHSGNYREYVYHHAAGVTPATRWVVRTAILGGDNTFIGDNTFSGNTTFSGDIYFGGAIGAELRVSGIRAEMFDFRDSVTIDASAGVTYNLPNIVDHPFDYCDKLTIQAMKFYNTSGSSQSISVRFPTDAGTYRGFFVCLYDATAPRDPNYIGECRSWGTPVVQNTYMATFRIIEKSSILNGIRSCIAVYSKIT